MTTEQLPKDPVSLDDLKIMIDGYDRNRRDPDAHWHRAEAWSTAFQWLLQYASTQGDQYPTFMEGISLIREKLP